MGPDCGRRIGILGGSFDPVHVGHLALGRAACEALRLDRLLVIPTGNSWQKSGEGTVRTPAVHRLAMVRIALQSRPSHDSACRWETDEIEVRREGPSYTVDTLHELRDRFGPEPALVLLLGSDQVHNLPTWHRWEELFDLAHIVIAHRPGYPLGELQAALPSPLRKAFLQRLAPDAGVLGIAPAGTRTRDTPGGM